jgi:hypothetical protein
MRSAESPSDGSRGASPLSLDVPSLLNCPTCRQKVAYAELQGHMLSAHPSQSPAKHLEDSSSSQLEQRCECQFPLSAFFV